ncbi:hypothetical protein KDK77_08740, partial [bacterium]|nr:hypothetical protein [bacterium]
VEPSTLPVTAHLLGKTMAESYLLGMTDRGWNNMRVTYRNGKPVKMNNIDFDDPFDPAKNINYINYADAFIEWLDIVRKNDGITIEVSDLLREFLSGFYGVGLDIQEAYARNRPAIEADPVLQANPHNDVVLRRLSGSDADMANLMSMVINRLIYTGKMPFNEETFLADVSHNRLLQSLAFELLMELQRRGKTTVPPVFAVSDITVRQIDADAELIEEGGHFSFEFRYTDAQGNEQALYVKSAFSDDPYQAVQSILGIFGREMFSLTTIEHSFKTYTAFHVMTQFGSIDGSQITDDSHIELFASLLGSAAADAYITGLGDRNLENIRFALKNAMPTAVGNIDFEYGFNPNVGVADVVKPFRELIDRFGPSYDTERKMMLATAFLRSFSTALTDFQEYYAEHFGSIETISQRFTSDALRTVWQNLRFRLDAEQSPVGSAIQSAAFQLGVWLDIALPAVTLIEQFKFERRVQQLVMDVLADADENGAIPLDTGIKLSEISINDTNLTPVLLSNNGQFFVDITVSQSGGRVKRFRMVSVKNTDNPYVSTLSTDVVSAEKTVSFLSENYPEGYKGSVLIDYENSQSIAEFDFTGRDVTTLARFVGRAFADSYAVGIGENGIDNMRFIRAANGQLRTVLYFNHLHNLDLDVSIAVLSKRAEEFIRFAQARGLSGEQLPVLAKALLEGITERMQEIHEHYNQNQQVIEQSRLFSQNRSWNQFVERMNPAKTNIFDLLLPIKNMAAELIDSQIPIKSLKISKQVKINNLKHIGLRVLTRLAEIGEIDSYPVPVTTDMTIGKFKIDDNALWFEVTTRFENGTERTYFIKSAKTESDETYYAVNGLEAIGRFPFTYMYSPEHYQQFNGFHVTSIVGSKGLHEITATEPYIAFIAAKFGAALAEAFVFGLANRSPENLRIMYDQLTPVSVENVDFDHALNPNVSIGEIVAHMRQFIYQVFPSHAKTNERSELASSILLGFRNTLEHIQEFYAEHRDELSTHPVLADHNNWQVLLSRMDSRLTVSSEIVSQAVTLLNQPAPEYGINEGLHIDNELLVGEHGLTEEEKLNDFLYREDFSITSYLEQPKSLGTNNYLNKRGDILLKVEAPATQRIRRLLAAKIYGRQNVVLAMMIYVGNLFFTRYRLSLAANRLGGLVPAMYRFRTFKALTISQRRQRIFFHRGYFQEKTRYTLGQAFSVLAQQQDMNGINALIDAYFNYIQQLWRRGVYDTSLDISSRFGLNDLNKMDIALTDFDGLTGNKLYATFSVASSRAVLEFIRKELINTLPPQSMEYFLQKFRQTYTVANFNRNWKTEDIRNRTARVEISRPALRDPRYGTRPPRSEQAQPAQDAVDIQAYVDAQNFRRYIPETGHNIVDSTVHVSQSGRHFLKEDNTFFQKLSNRIPLWRQTGRNIYLNTFGFLVGYFFFRSGEKIAAKRLGGIVPPMHIITPDDRLTIMRNGRRHSVHRGYIQDRVFLPVSNAFRALNSVEYVPDINAILDKYFALAEEMWRRGVFDKDIFFTQNYGFNA